MNNVFHYETTVSSSIYGSVYDVYLECTTNRRICHLHPKKAWFNDPVHVEKVVSLTASGIMVESIPMEYLECFRYENVHPNKAKEYGRWIFHGGSHG